MTAFAAVALAAALLPLSRRAALAAAVAGVGLAVFSYVRSPMAERPDFDRVADALVAEGWKPGDPILVVGSLPDFRSPLEWYLPGDVILAEAEPANVHNPLRRHRRSGWTRASRRDRVDELGRRESGRGGPRSMEQVDRCRGRLLGGRFLDSAAGEGCLRPIEDRRLT